MQKQIGNSQHLQIIHARKLLFTLVALVAFQFYATAQTRFTRITFNAAYTPISIGGGATSSTATGDNANQTGIPIGFNFGYADSTFSTIGLSTNGLIWFDAIAPAVATGNINLVTTGTPNQSLAPWCNNLIDDASSDILYQTQGSPGSRTFTIQYTNYPTFYTGAGGTNVRMNCQVILYETSNVIEFRYGTLNVTGIQTTSGGAMIGMEWGTGGSGKFIDAVTGSNSVNHRMLSPLDCWPKYNFRFTPGIPTAIPVGTYNVGVGQTYNSLTEAVADVNHRGISGAVTLNLTDVQYDTSAANGSNIFPIFVATPNSSSTNALTISKAGAPATLAYRGSDITASGASFGSDVGTGWLSHTEVPILCVSSSYNTISNLNLVTHGSSPQPVDFGLLMKADTSGVGCHHNLFDKISVDLDRTYGNATGIATSTANNSGLSGNTYNTWQDFSIKDCNYGFGLFGNSVESDLYNQIITSSCTTYNYIGNPNTPDDIISSGGSVYGIYITQQRNFTIRNCIIQNITGTGGAASVNGIYVNTDNGAGINEISNCIIRTLKRTNTANVNQSVCGIFYTYGNNTGLTHKIFNNSISNLISGYTGAATTNRAAIGIYYSVNNGTSGIVLSEIYNNSISIDGSTFPNASSACFFSYSVSKRFQIKNNVFANYTTGQTGVANHGCFYTNAAANYGDGVSLSDYNSYYLADTTNGYLGRALTTNYLTLAAWQAAMTSNPGTDANSQVANPNFVNNATDLHSNTTSTILDGKGTTPPAYITTDYDCETRNAPHDIGFDDYTPGCPADGGTISPAVATVCATTTYNMTSTGFSTPNNTYQWMVSTTSGGPYSNVTGGSGANTTSYTTGSLTAGTKYYVLKATCANGNFDLSNQLTITVNSLPTNTITPAGPTTFCSGGSVVLNATVAANRSYQWKKGANIISGATLSSYTAATGASYKVIITNTITGCSKTTPTATVVTVNPLPTATITPSGPTSFCAGDSVVLQANTGVGLTYKWKKALSYIPGATLSSYTAKTGGSYKVEITNTNGCSKLSAAAVVSIVCREGEDNLSGIENSISIFPNPANAEININIFPDENFEIEIFNTLGERLVKIENQNTIDISYLESGIYFVKLFYGNDVITEKLVKE